MGIARRPTHSVVPGLTRDPYSAAGVRGTPRDDIALADLTTVVI